MGCVCVCKATIPLRVRDETVAAADAAEDARLWKTRRRRGGGHGVFNICLKAVRKR